MVYAFERFFNFFYSAGRQDVPLLCLNRNRKKAEKQNSSEVTIPMPAVTVIEITYKSFFFEEFLCIPVCLYF
jgi:hypothetical protein